MVKRIDSFSRQPLSSHKNRPRRNPYNEKNPKYSGAFGDYSSFSEELDKLSEPEAQPEQPPVEEKS